MKRILVIEDDAAILRGLTDALKNEHYDVQSVTNGTKGYALALKGPYDLLILDIMLPDMSGLEICKSLREAGNHTPIVMLTGKGEEVDKVLGLEFGADDYVTKPFGVRELMARLKAVLRRQTLQQKEVTQATFGNVQVDFKKHEALKGKKKIEMSAKELQLLKYFIEHQGDVISRSQLLDDVWGYETTPTTRTVDNYILSLRKKIESKPSSPKHLLTVHTAGYKFVL
jgi:DNA-binding response OmpR family regulator